MCMQSSTGVVVTSPNRKISDKQNRHTFTAKRIRCDAVGTWWVSAAIERTQLLFILTQLNEVFKRYHRRHARQIARKNLQLQKENDHLKDSVHFSKNGYSIVKSFGSPEWVNELNNQEKTANKRPE